MFPPREREDLAAVVWSPPFRALALKPPRRLWTPPSVWSGPSGPLCLLWPSSEPIDRSKLASKGAKGLNPRSRPCVASIDAAGLTWGAARGGGSNRGISRGGAVWAPIPRAFGQNPPFRSLALKSPRRLWTPPSVRSAPSALCAFCGHPPPSIRRRRKGVPRAWTSPTATTPWPGTERSPPLLRRKSA